ncbi:MAG: hypothetical protein GVY11_03960 [Gammaproteobacteria bacterium]|nr:hypothetical protein [Gammaproteobacteria bacterium]
MRRLQRQVVVEADPGGQAGEAARVAAGHSFAGISLCDNIVALRTETYRDQFTWIPGPGAGADITALQVWAEVVAGEHAWPYTPGQVLWSRSACPPEY